MIQQNIKVSVWVVEKVMRKKGWKREIAKPPSGERWLSGAGCTGKRRQMESWQVWGIRYLLYTEAMDM